MKVIISAIAIGLISYFAESLAPWWIGAVIAFLVAAIAQMKPWGAFLAGFLGLGLLWGVSAGIIDSQNHGVLSSRIGQLFGGLSSISIIALTTLIGALVGALGAMSGASAMRLLVDK